MKDFCSKILFVICMFDKCFANNKGLTSIFCTYIATKNLTYNIECPILYVKLLYACVASFFLLVNLN